MPSIKKTDESEVTITPALRLQLDRDAKSGQYPAAGAPRDDELELELLGRSKRKGGTP